jgi:sarcosine oxidase delta subunit
MIRDITAESYWSPEIECQGCASWFVEDRDNVSRLGDIVNYYRLAERNRKNFLNGSVDQQLIEAK